MGPQDGTPCDNISTRRRLRRLQVMSNSGLFAFALIECGLVILLLAEFNIYVDPEGASVVFRSGVPVTMVGLDVTRECILTANHVKGLEAGGDALSQAAARIARNDLERRRQAGRTGSPGRAMHDPLVVATFIDRAVVRLREYFVAVETQGELTAGETVGYGEVPLRQSAPLKDLPTLSEAASATFVPITRVAVEVDPARFFQMFIARLAGRA